MLCLPGVPGAGCFPVRSSTSRLRGHACRPDGAVATLLVVVQGNSLSLQAPSPAGDACRCGSDCASGAVTASRRGLQCEQRTQSLDVRAGSRFQLEALLRNGRITTGEIESSLNAIRALCETYPEHECARVGDLLRKFNIELGKRPANESPRACFDRVMKLFQFTELHITPGYFQCCHIIFTPTRTVLEGPYPVQSNRIIRRYPGYEHHFIRVEYVLCLLLYPRSS